MRAGIIKKAILLAAAAAALTAACYGLTLIFHSPGAEVKSLSAQAVSVLPQAQLRPVNASLRDGRAFRPEREDAQLYIEGVESETCALYLETEEPLPPQTYCQLFYSLDGEGLSGRASVEMLLPYSADLVAFTLPEARRYAFFRLDIDAPYTIRDLKTSPDAPPGSYYAYAELVGQGLVPVPWSRLLLGFALFFAGGLMLLPRKKRGKEKTK